MRLLIAEHDASCDAALLHISTGGDTLQAFRRNLHEDLCVYGDCRKEPRPMYKTKESGNSSDSSQSRRCEMDQNGWDDRKSYFNEWHMIREEPRKDGIWGKRNSRISGLNTGLSGCAMS
ncbi:hypothetical protein TgHK011_007831 [Trichoderma gracile]|nr:hypothetical protein TgHK011_007831 [Trichoderma gracile]